MTKHPNPKSGLSGEFELIVISISFQMGIRYIYGKLKFEALGKEKTNNGNVV